MSVGARLERALSREMQGEKFVTAVLAEVSDERSLTLLHYGHPAPLVMHADGSTRFAEPPHRALPLGLGLHGAAGPESYEASFAPGDGYFLCTDGATEARGGAGRCGTVLPARRAGAPAQGHRPGSRPESPARRSPAALDALQGQRSRITGRPTPDSATGPSTIMSA